jgi:hypothetical protein
LAAAKTMDDAALSADATFPAASCMLPCLFAELTSAWNAVAAPQTSYRILKNKVPRETAAVELRHEMPHRPLFYQLRQTLLSWDQG